MAPLVTVVFSVLCMTTIVTTYPNGPPTSTCSTMRPFHAGIPGQSSAPPFSITASKDTYSPNDIITVTLTDTGGMAFKGFLLQAVSGGAVVGTFSVTANTKLLNCGSGNGITQNKRLSTSSISVQFTAPNVAQLQFRATVVRSFSTFWVKFLGPTLTRIIPNAVTESEMAGHEEKHFSLADLPSQSYEVKWEAPLDGQVQFRVRAALGFEVTDNRYMSIGFSKDEKMADTSVVDCIMKGASGTVGVQASYNADTGHSNSVDAAGNAGLELLSGSFEGGILECLFKRNISLAGNAKFFDLGARTYRLQVASGVVNQNDLKVIHGLQRGSRPLYSTEFADFLVKGRFHTLE